jgi:hypothetical protein
MNAQVFDITSRQKPLPFEIAGIGDFELSEKDTVDAGTILEDPNISLYCLDPGNEQAIFVKVPDIVETFQAPFFYIGQFQDAVKVLKVSYEDMHQLAGQVELDDQRIILIHSIGRCGTTLASAAFSQAEDVVSLSEPDIFSQLVRMLDFSNGDRPQISELAKSCMLLTCKDSVNGRQPIWVLKFRSFVIEIADMIYDHFPGTKNLFLYRHAVPWGKSMTRAFGGDAYPTQEQMVFFWMWMKMVISKLDRYNLESMEEINASLLISMMWLGLMERCLERLDAGQPILPVRYEDLKADPELVINKIFDYCGVRASDKDVLHAVLYKDSQAESEISREQLEQIDWELTPEDIASIHRIIADQPVINTPDYVLPGTLTLT